MDAFQFYPTPNNLSCRAWSKFIDKDFTRVLEPSAGNGELARPEFDDEDLSQRFRYHSRHTTIDCCEIDISKHATLRSKNLNVVGFDFMQFKNGAIYSHCIMNPPFADGAKHVLKAWDILWDAEIVAILNAETIRNPFSNDRKRLVDLIDKHGEVEFIQDAFTVQEAERKTSVEVALVWMRKKANVSEDIIGPLLEELKVDTKSDEELANGYQRGSELAIPNSLIDNSVAAFNAAVRAMREAVCSEARASYYADLLGETMSVRNGDTDSTSTATSVEHVRKTIGERYIELKDRAWAGILRSTNVTSRLSSEAQRRLESEFENIKQLEFTSLTIHGFLCGIVEKQGAIHIEMVCDIFDLITKYATDNAHFFKGWKSNDKHKTCAMQIKNTRFILPGHSTFISSSLRWESQQVLKDIDKVFALLDGKREPEHSLVALFDTQFSELKRGARVSCSYFDVRYYPGIGTIHFFPTNKTLIRRLNVMVGRHRSWLPKEGDRVPDAFWLQFDNASKYDKEFRSEIEKRAKGMRFWEHPLHNLNVKDERGSAAVAMIDEAVTTVLERHGINTDFQIGNAQEPQLLLEAA